jgi:alpha-glucan,water dikinase
MSKVYISFLPLCREITESELMQSSSPNAQADDAIPSLSLVKKKFLGKYAISAEDFNDEMVTIQI